MPSQNPTYTKLTDRGISFGVLRTNPKLTSNVKLTVDSTEKLWFNSIDATAELAQNKYKNFPIDPMSNHEVNLFKFYDYGQTPSKISFAVGTTVTIDTIAKDLKDQFDFDNYSSGAKYLPSKNYQEKFSYLAPLYLGSVLPECFVIFKVPGASNYSVGEWRNMLADPEFSQTKFALDLFKQAVAVKTFSLTESSPVGQYIRNILRNPMYPQNPLYVNFKEDRFSVYRGASITSGTYVEIPELLSSTLRKSIPQLKLEKYVTEGFERNNIIYSKIINLEFLFNDETSDPYTFNRYFGFYCNLIDLAKFEIDIEKMYENTEDNDNPLSFMFRQEDEVSVGITNPNGVVLRGIGLESDLSQFNSAMSDDSNIFFPYLKVKDQSLRFLKNQSFEQVGTRVTASINDFDFDLGLTFGPGDLLSQEIASSSTLDTRSTVALTFNSIPNHLDTIRVYHQNGSTFDPSDIYGRYDDLIFIVDQYVTVPYSNRVFPNGEAYFVSYPVTQQINFDTIDPNSGSPTFTPNSPTVLGTQYTSQVTGKKWMWNGNEYVIGAFGSRIYINLDNATVSSNMATDLSLLAKTVIEVIKSLKNSFLTGKSFENIAFIQVLTPGNSHGQLAIRAMQSSAFLVNGNTTDSVIYADGGFRSKEQAIVPIGNVARLQSQLDQLVVKTERDWSKILRVCNSVVSIDEISELTTDSVSKYFSNATFMLKDDESIVVDYSKIEIRNLFKPTFGVLSMFEMKDLDFYTYSTQYSKIPEIDLYQNYYIPQNMRILDFTSTVYQMVGKGQILVNGITYSTDSIDLAVWQNTEGLHLYTVLAGDVILVPSSKIPANQSVTRYDVPILDEDQNLQDFPGFFALGAEHSTPDKNLPTYSYREKYRTNNLSSEYHVYLENFSKEFATEGRVVPYISKWGIVDSTDARGNSYRLNSDIVFGKDNFGPSHRETSPTPEKLTHEWFYIESDFNYSLSPDLLKKNNYYFNDPLNISDLISDSTYFERYFTYIPTVDEIEIDRPQYRFSKLNRDQFSNQYTTIFNGAKFIFSELGSDGKILPVTDRFVDYNFSILLKPIKEDLLNVQSPIKYRIIENIEAKSILILIEVAVSDVSEINSSFLFNLDENNFPDKRMDQLTLFLSSAITNESIPTAFNVDRIYTTENSLQGDSVFNSIMNASYPSFSSFSYNQGIATDSHSNLEFANPTPNKTEVIQIIKGSDPTGLTGFIVAFADSSLYKMVDSGRLQSGCINSSANYITTQYLSIGSQKVGYLINESSPFRVIKDSSTTLRMVTLSPTHDLVIRRTIPGFLSAFGDYRLSFNEAGVSNLTYNFLYSAKDKKYNTTKASYSAVKLAIGVDLSSVAKYENDNNYFIAAKPLIGLNSTEFKLENFVNPISGSHDSLINPNRVILGGSVPLPAFSPLMFISKNGEVSILMNTSANFSLSGIPLEIELSNPTITNHAIARVSEDLLTLEKSATKQTVVLNVKFDADPITGAVFNFVKQSFPTGSSSTWLTNAQQFQIFGGKGYFANLFETLSFASFISLLENGSDLISWETYSNGIRISDKTISIQIEEADVVNKSTIVTAVPEIVNTASKTKVGGFTHTEENSTAYEIFRYSGEYDVIYRPISGFKQNGTINKFTFNGANVFLNSNITDFFVIPEFSFVKYSAFNILDFENSQKFEPVYPMIFESPIDFGQYKVLSSSWDFNYHYEYSSKSSKVTVPGSRRLTEDYSFISKLLNVPLEFTAESFNVIELSNQEFEMPDSEFIILTRNGALIDFAYSVYVSEIRFKINLSQVIAKALSETSSTESRLRVEFQKFFTDQYSQPISKDPEVLGDLTFDQYLYQYCKTNLVKLYTLDTVDFYERPDHSLPDNSISVAEVPYDQLDDAGYVSTKTVKINNINSDTINGSLLKKFSSGISLVPKLKIKYI